MANPESVTKTADALTENEAGFAATFFGEIDAGVAAFQTYSKEACAVLMPGRDRLARVLNNTAATRPLRKSTSI